MENNVRPRTWGAVLRRSLLGACLWAVTCSCLYVFDLSGFSMFVSFPLLMRKMVCLVRVTVSYSLVSMFSGYVLAVYLI